MRVIIALALGVAACSFERAGPPATADTLATADTASPAPTVLLVDPAQPVATAGDSGWGYSVVQEADLDGDGATERLVTTARVEMYRGRPAWDDGQQWQVYVEEADGTRTTVYARFVQLGSITVRLGAARPPVIVILEQLPDRTSVYEVGYRGPDRVEAKEAWSRQLDPTGEAASPRFP